MTASPQPIPPKIQSQPSLWVFVVVMLGFIGLVATSVLFFFDPTKYGFYPICQFHLLTGLYCPGCGATRAGYQLLHGNWLAALHDNALFVLSLPLLALRGAWLLKQSIDHRPVRFVIPPAALWIFLVAAVAFVVLRNFPAFSFLAPR